MYWSSNEYKPFDEYIEKAMIFSTVTEAIEYGLCVIDSVKCKQCMQYGLCDNCESLMELRKKWVSGEDRWNSAESKWHGFRIGLGEISNQYTQKEWLFIDSRNKQAKIFNTEKEAIDAGEDMCLNDCVFDNDGEPIPFDEDYQERIEEWKKPAKESNITSLLSSGPQDFDYYFPESITEGTCYDLVRRIYIG